MAILTISRQIGSMGDEIAQTLADRMGWALLNREKMLELIFEPVCSETEMFRLRERKILPGRACSQGNIS